jgi:Protein of unknown function (DUF1488)
MSEVSFPSTHKHLFERAMIEFPAVVDGKAITCRITLEEMIREFKRGTTPASFEEHFRMLRPEIEERARKEILAKGKESQ